MFTPRGQIFVLPKGATVIDFAYAVHSDVGNHCVAARVDRRLAPLRTQLRNGQTVEIITKPNNRPNPAWLDFVVTGKARATIRSLPQASRTQGGRRARVGACSNANSRRWGDQLDQVWSTRTDVQTVLDELGIETSITCSNRSAWATAWPSWWRACWCTRRPAAAGRRAGPAGSLTIKGTEGMVVNFAKCCGPIPGDPIVAIFSPGRGLVVHHHDCPNLGDFRRQGQSWLDVQWAEDVSGEFSTTIRVDAGNQRGMLATIASLIADEGSNIEDVRSEERDGLSTSLRFVISVRERKHLASIIRRLKNVPFVLRINRVIG